MKKISYFWRHGLWALISLGFLLLIAFAALYIYVESQLPDIESLKTVKLEVPMQIYTQDGLLIQEYGEIKRIPIAYDNIPKKLIQALLVTEDQRFFEHPGVDIFGLARATVRMIKTHSKSQGGSTITMQVARNFFLNRKKTFLRKFNEIVLAVKIDHELSKEKILELYMNKIYLGNRAYGVEAAAHVYYGKPLNELNLAELAKVAGPMLVILTVNIGMTLAFAAFVVWPLLGRDHEAAVMVAGLVGFGVGSTATAVAAMNAIVRRRGPAPRAQAIVPATGGFLIDLTNAPTTTAFLQWLR